ncbi:hypothetical protein J4462_03720 [Candidatus Pacearchaeota archaeon]|nr:hypothetical protein [Candidatus Pacearchaeota archaeon]
METKKSIWKKLRNGKHRGIEVDLQWKPNMIERMMFHFTRKRFTISDVKNYFDITRIQAHNRVSALKKSGWIKADKLETKKKVKDRAKFQMSLDKYENYLERFGSLYRGYLVKEHKQKPKQEIKFVRETLKEEITGETS